MTGTVGDFICRRLQAWGVRRVFGYPGDGIGGLVGALARTKGAIDFVQVRHEEMAGLMACATAKFTGEVGVCIATSRPGAVHLLNGLYDKKCGVQRFGRSRRDAASRSPFGQARFPVNPPRRLLCAQINLRISFFQHGKGVRQLRSTRQ